MKNWLKITLLTAGVGAVAGTVYYFVRTAPGNELLAYVPNNAGYLVKFNLPEIAKALEPHQKEIEKFTMFKDKGLKQSDALLQVAVNMMRNPAKSGIDFSTPAFMFSESQTRGDVSGFVVKLKEHENFTQYVKKYTPAGNEAGKSGDIEFAEFDVGLWVSWNQSVAMITDQKAEDKSYFENILNKRNPGAQGNLLLNKIGEQKGLVSAILVLDELATSHEFGKNLNPMVDDMQSPFPAGTAILANVFIENGEVHSEMKLTSLNPEKLNAIQLFKPKGNIDKHANALFNGNIPVAAVSVSVNPSVLFDMLKKAFPDSESEEKNPESEAFVNDLKAVISGDITLGFSYKKDKLEAFKSAAKMGTYDFDAEPFYGFIAYIGTKTDARTFIADNLPMVVPDADGIYTAPPSWGNFKFFVQEREIIIADNATTLKELRKATFKQPAPLHPFVLGPHSNAPLYLNLSTEGTSELSQSYMFGSSGSRKFQSYMDMYASNSYCYVENGVFHYTFGMKDKKTHPIMQFLQYFENEYKENKKREETLRKLRGGDAANQENYRN